MQSIRFTHSVGFASAFNAEPRQLVTVDFAPVHSGSVRFVQALSAIAQKFRCGDAHSGVPSPSGTWVHTDGFASAASIRRARQQNGLPGALAVTASHAWQQTVLKSLKPEPHTALKLSQNPEHALSPHVADPMGNAVASVQLVPVETLVDSMEAPLEPLVEEPVVPVPVARDPPCPSCSLMKS